MKKNIAMISYFTWIGWIVAIYLFSFKENRDSYTRFHIRQSFGLGLLVIFCYVISLLFDFSLLYFSLPSLLIFILLFVLWFLGFKSAMDEKERPLPIIGKYFQRWFSFFQ